MTPLEFSTTINAPKEKVWNTLWREAGYRKWTAVFMEGSYAESNWAEGSPIRFLSPAGEGMYGIIQKKVLYEQMVFEHRGEIKNGREEPQEWAGATEAYYLTETDGSTTLRVVMDANEQMAAYFSSVFPKALDVLKREAEA